MAKSFHSSAVNVDPRSEVMCSGTLNLAFHEQSGALAHDAEVASSIGVASGQRVDRSSEEIALSVRYREWSDDNVNVSKPARWLREGIDG